MMPNDPQPEDFDPEREHQSWDFSLNLNQSSSDQKILALQQKYLDLAASRGQFGIQSESFRTQVLALFIRSLHLIPTSVPKENAQGPEESIQPICLGSCQKKGLAASALLQLQVRGTSRTLAPLRSLMRDSVLESIPPVNYPIGEIYGKVYEEPVGLMLTATNAPRAEIVLTESAFEEDIEYAKANTSEIKKSIEGKLYTTSPRISSIACAMAFAQTRRDIFAHLCAPSNETFYFIGISDFDGPLGTTRNSCRFKIESHLVTVDGPGITAGLVRAVQTIKFSDHIKWVMEPNGLVRTESLQSHVTRLSA